MLFLRLAMDTPASKNLLSSGALKKESTHSLSTIHMEMVCAVRMARDFTK
jgi:hypothetical protein